MKLHPRLSRAALELVTRFETFHPQAPPAAAGGWTLGYGHTRSAREGGHVTRRDAEALLLYDLSVAADGVADALFAPVTQRQFEALTAFAFNIGLENFRRSSALARINAGSELDAADEIERWRRAELGAGAQVVDALVRRRAAEKAHFLGLPEGFSKSPSAVLRPLALEGGETQEPSPPAETASSSATLHAANNVQARLRALVPEPTLDAADEPPPPEAPPFPHVEITDLEVDPQVPADDLEPAFDFGTSIHATSPPPANDLTSLEPTPSAALGSVGGVLGASPPLPPPPPPPAPGTLAQSTFAEDVGETSFEAEPASGTPEANPAPTTAKPKPSARMASALLTALGACLFVTAALLILAGKPGFGNLGLGVVGALIMTPGVYGLLGPRTSAG